MGSRRLRVDNIPFYINPIVKAYGWIGTSIWSSTLQYWRSKCRWKFVRGRKGNISNEEEEIRPYMKQCIHVSWHENVPAYMCYYMIDTTLPHRHIWLQHPAVYMAPIHSLLNKYNVEYVLGSSGHDGQKALESLLQNMTTKNLSTAFFPDGPSGPIHEVKPGAVQLAQATGLPLIPIKFNFSDSRRMKGWDSKHFPRSGSTIIVHEFDPIYVGPTDADIQAAINDLQEKLDGG